MPSHRIDLECKQLEWLAKISTRHEAELRRLQSAQSEARCQRQHLERLAKFSPRHRRELLELRNREAEACADEDRALRRFVEAIAAPEGVIPVREANWDPAKHPRLGTDPNAGWFATTAGGSAGAQSSRSRDGQPRSAPTDSAIPQSPTTGSAQTHGALSRAYLVTTALSRNARPVSYHASGGAPDILNPTSDNSVSRSFWEHLRRGNWEAAADLLNDLTEILDPGKLRAARTALKRIKSIDKWRKRFSKRASRKAIQRELETLEKTLADHLKKRGGVDTAETTLFRYQIDYLKGLLK